MDVHRITSPADLVAVVRRRSPELAERAACGGFDGADLRDLRLERLTLAGASFRRADLRGTVFVACDLGEADLAEAIGVLPYAFPGCDLRWATLPAGLSFDAPLATIEGAVAYARAAFLVLAAASLYCLLTVGGTTDRDLLVDSASTALPIVDTPVTLTAFYFVSPALLLAGVVWMHAYLQRVWATLAALPARFADGLALGDRIDQWIPLSVGCRAPAGERAIFGRLEATLSAGVLWPIPPMVMLVMWARHLPRHDLLVSAWQIAVLALCLGFGAVFAVRARRTLRRTLPTRGRGSEAGWAVTAAAAAVAVLLPVTCAVIDPWRPGPLGVGAARLVALADAIGLPHRLQLSGAEVAVRPPGWSPALGGERLDAAVAAVPRVDLAGRNLDRAVAGYAFFANAGLDGARMRAFNAPAATFVRASLVGADLAEAKLAFADLRDADLAGATLAGADLTRANLRGACFSGANLLDARLDGADLRGADLAGAFGLGPRQLATAVCDGRTRLPFGLSPNACGAASPPSAGSDVDGVNGPADTSFVPPNCS